MADLYRALRGNNDHDHLILITGDSPPLPNPGPAPMDPIAAGNPPMGPSIVGVTSTDQDHVHDIVMDPRSGMLQVGEANGHTHEIGDLPEPLRQKPAKSKDPDEPDSGAITQAAYGDSGTAGGAIPDDPYAFNTKEEAKELAVALKLYKALQDREDESQREANEAREFREGKQWDETVAKELDADDRAHVVINYTGALVDLLSGYFRNNRRDPRAFPVEGGDSKVADVLNMAMKQVAHECKFAIRGVQGFEDELVEGRGCFELDMNFEQDVRGTIDIRYVDNSKVRFGPHKELDASDAECATVEEWVGLDRIKALFPDRAKALDKAAALASDDEIKTVLSQPTLKEWGAEILKTVNDPTFVNQTAYDQSLKFIKMERQEYRTAHFIVSDDATIIQEVTKGMANKARTLPGLSVVQVPRTRLRRTVFVGPVLLDDYYPDLPFPGLSLVPVYAYLTKLGAFYGKVRCAKDPQRETNKRHSQIIDIVNKCAGYGRWYDDQTFDDPREVDNFLENGGKAGYVGKLRSTEHPPIKEEGTKIPSEVLKVEEVNIEQFYRATNVSPQLFGMTEYAQESGKSQQIKQRAALLGNEFLFDNFYASMKTLWTRVVRMIQEYYDPERLARLCIANAVREQQTSMVVGGQDMDPDAAETKQAIEAIFSTADLTKYDVVIDDGPMSPTTQETELTRWMEFNQYSPGIVPPEMLVELSSLGNKNKWGRIMAARAEQAAAMEKAKAQADIIKAGRGTTEAAIGSNPQGQGTGGPSGAPAN